LLKNPKELSLAVEQIIEHQHRLQKKIEYLYREKAREIREKLSDQNIPVSKGTAIISAVSLDAADALKDLCFQLKETDSKLIVVLFAEADGKPLIHVGCSKSWLDNGGLNAAEMIKSLASLIRGGGGGQAFYASAGGSDKSGLALVKEKAIALLTS
jgi:alanyl-tRNA synthetase